MNLAGLAATPILHHEKPIQLMECLRRALCVPMNMFWPTAYPENPKLYSFVEVAGFYGFWVGLIWLMGEMGWG